MKIPRKGYQTQWAGQYGVAHELARRGYLVSFTMGNARGIDLICQSPGRVLFSVQVKSCSSKTPFLYQRSLLESNPSLFFVFVYLPTAPDKPPEYYVLTNKQFQQVAKEQCRLDRKAEDRRGKPYAAFSPGIGYRTLAGHNNFRDAWRNLPD